MPTRSSRLVLLVGLAALALAACSSGDGGDGGDGRSAPTAPARPAGPAADLSQELTAGDATFLAAGTAGTPLDEVGWVEHEYAAAGTATSYVTDGDFPRDGRLVLRPGATADYRTRIVVRRPAKAADFHGTVLVEWLNVSGGLDANPDYAFLADELARRGVAWVGVSAQRIGVEGGPVAVASGAGGDLPGKGLKRIDPARYGSLHHPGDAYAYDIFTQVARALRAPGGSGVLGDLEVRHVLAVGESQSAFALTTYVDGVAPLTKAFDGYLIHSRGGAALPLGEPGDGVSIASAIGKDPVTIRTDQDVPVLVLETETDVTSVLGYYAARQPDSARFRLWEIAGTAHADRTLVGPLADTLDCGVAINDGPQRYVVRAALRWLDRWVRTGEAPPKAPRLQVDDAGGTATIVRDADGIALGGIRLPQVDVPVATLSGEPGPTGGVICLLLGSTRPFTEQQLARYPSRSSYLDAYRAATDAAIDAGFALPEDRPAILADADPSRLPR